MLPFASCAAIAAFSMFNSLTFNCKITALPLNRFFKHLGHKLGPVFPRGLLPCDFCVTNAVTMATRFAVGLFAADAIPAY